MEMAASVFNLLSPVPASNIDSPPIQQAQEIEHDLEGKTVKELKRIIRERKVVTKKKRKSDMISAILRHNAVPPDAQSRVGRQLLLAPRVDGDIHHAHYKEHYNSIDQHDRYWYQLECQHPISQWRAKFILSVLQSSMINSWILFKYFGGLGLREYREEIIKSIFEFK
jgi:hypothetical protein